VVAQLKEYLETTDFQDLAEDIAGQINGVAPDLKKEKKELADITAQINNGVKAILAGVSIPEPEEEMDRLRVRKSELEDIISHREHHSETITAEDILSQIGRDCLSWDETRIPALVKQHITKIYVHADGSCTVNMGVHTDVFGQQKKMQDALAGDYGNPYEGVLFAHI